LNYVNGIFCKTESEKQFTDIYRIFSNSETSYEQLFIEKKQLIVEKNLAGDVDNLAQILKE
jgi:(1->4)-alpha-D-glucan 1-alpha-D-glucosylmutase